MINFSNISKTSFIGKFLRSLIKIIPDNSVLPIIQGSAKGMKWTIGSGVYGYWLGSFEAKKQKIFTNLIKKNQVVFDIGAHVGFYTLIASKKVGEKGQVFSFEPLDRNIKYLKKHLHLNNINNVELIEKAVSDREGEVYFDIGDSTSMGKITNSKKTNKKVETIKLDNFIKEREIPKPDLIKMDIEGEELKALEGAKEMLSEKHPIILLATHGDKVHKKCIKFLENLNYNIKSINEKGIDNSDELIAKY